MTITPGPSGAWPRATARRLVIAAVMSLAVAASAWAQAGPPQVTVANPACQPCRTVGRVHRTVRGQGSASRYTPRVSGYIDKVHFRDGSTVKQGDLLFTIDQRPFQLAVDSAQSDVVRTKAQVVLDVADYERSQQLVKTAATPVRGLDQRKANLDIARAQELAGRGGAAARHSSTSNGQRSARRSRGRISRPPRRSRKPRRRRPERRDAAHHDRQPRSDLFRVRRLGGGLHPLLAAERRRAARRSSRDAPNPVKVRLADETDLDAPRP